MPSFTRSGRAYKVTPPRTPPPRLRPVSPAPALRLAGTPMSLHSHIAAIHSNIRTLGYRAAGLSVPGLGANAMVYNAFNKLRNQAQVSYVAELFQKDKRDLSTFLKSFLNNEEMAKLYRIVANKPLLL